MKFSELPYGAEFRAKPKGQRFGDTIFTKLPKSKIHGAPTPCSDCGSTAETWNAHNGSNTVHFCPHTEVYEV